MFNLISASLARIKSFTKTFKHYPIAYRNYWNSVFAQALWVLGLNKLLARFGIKFYRTGYRFHGTGRTGHSYWFRNRAELERGIRWGNHHHGAILVLWLEEMV